MPKSTEEIGFEHKGIGSVLAHNRLAVPLNQREYSWEDEHVQELFTDFANAIAKNKATYFLGTVVLTRGEGEIPEVSDGQQRLATTTILLAAIRDYFFRKGDTVRAASLEQSFLKTTDLETTATVPKLRMNVDDNEFFTKYITASPNDADRKIQPTKESHKRIQAAAKNAAKHIKAILAPFASADSARTSRLLEWVKFVEKGALVIILRVPDHLNAFVMFETLNDRGLKASQADLLKNHLLSFAGDRIREGQQKWAKMLGVLESLGQDDITVTYLHHLLITKSGPTTAREVFDKVKATVDSQARAMVFLDELAESANDYAALFNSDHRKWNEYGTGTRHNITTINRDLRVLQIRPLMFAVSKHFAVKEARAAFRMFVFWSVRFLVVGGRGGLLDRNYAIAAHKIGQGEITTAAGVAAELAAIIPSDAVFETEFAEARVSKSFLARYYLRALEMKVKANPEPEFVPSDDEQTINLEHVLPENPDNSWPIQPELAGAYYNRLGNMVILQAAKNSLIGNSSFTEKKPVLETSTYLLTKSVGTNNTAWGVLEINNRQKELAALAVKTWPLSV